MNMDWNTALSIVFIVIFVIMMLRGGCCGGMKGGGCGTGSKPRSEEDDANTREGDQQETELRNRLDGGA